MKDNMNTFRFFDQVTVRVWKTGHFYPWRFSVQQDGFPEVNFVGVPNQCETKHSALMRGWYRAKWIVEGTYNRKYK